MDDIIIKKANIELHKLEAQFYDQVHFEIFNEAEQKYVDETLSRLWITLRSKQICLDIGCGTGNITKREHEVFAQVIGLDLSRCMLLKLKEGTKSQNLSLVCGDCENLPLKDNIFDFISMYSTLHHLPRPFPALKEIFRVLKIGGMIYVAHEPNALKSRLILTFPRKIASQLGRLVTRKSLKYPRLISCQKKLGPNADIHAQTGFSPQEIKTRLQYIGFSNSNIVFHDLFQFLFAALPRPFNRLVDLDHLLEKNKITTHLCSTIIITAKK